MSKNKPRYDQRLTHYPDWWKPPKRNFLYTIYDILNVIGNPYISLPVLAFLFFVYFNNGGNSAPSVSELENSADYTITWETIKAYIIGNGHEPSKQELAQFIWMHEQLLKHYNINITPKKIFFKFQNRLDAYWYHASIDNEWKLSYIQVRTNDEKEQFLTMGHEIGHSIGRTITTDNSEENWSSIWYGFKVDNKPYSMVFDEVSAEYYNYVFTDFHNLSYPFSDNDAYIVYQKALFILIPDYQKTEKIRLFFNGKNNWDIGILFYCITWRYAEWLNDYRSLYYLSTQLKKLHDYEYDYRMKNWSNILNEWKLVGYLSQAREILIRWESIESLNIMDCIHR